MTSWACLSRNDDYFLSRVILRIRWHYTTRNTLTDQFAIYLPRSREISLRSQPILWSRMFHTHYPLQLSSAKPTPWPSSFFLSLFGFTITIIVVVIIIIINNNNKYNISVTVFYKFHISLNASNSTTLPQPTFLMTSSGSSSRSGATSESSAPISTPPTDPSPIRLEYVQVALTPREHKIVSYSNELYKFHKRLWLDALKQGEAGAAFQAKSDLAKASSRQRHRNSSTIEGVKRPASAPPINIKW
ncbi:uncharacterized protein EI90DRAFT_3015025 [Cantharellus anzutake]|uniref:uncharacterized protein n=1 Tax=Cantharellus anzutake TaxID=1750568 RepID=UPI0019049A66|nr:uncharacterized protein EI90DRAFT_3015025 [Cantharellus anzutake]KAF8333937.1 hypothetical protein EI90DRAFT_3015025 [Cantharellus anzutake]